MLNQLKHDVNKENIGLYSDHGLGGFHKKKRKKKQIVKRFKDVEYLSSFSAT